MRFTRSKGALVAAACAAFLVPSGVAAAASGPSTEGHSGSMRGNPVSTAAKAAGVCSDAKQIGETGHIKRGDETIASVKQYYSKECQENYGYVWVWDSFHKGADPYDLSIGVHNYDDDKVYGKRSLTGTQKQELWSGGTDTVKNTTAGIGTLRPAGDPTTYQGLSSKES